jgi:hypothetical protein
MRSEAQSTPIALYIGIVTSDTLAEDAMDALFKAHLGFVGPTSQEVRALLKKR